MITPDLISLVEAKDGLHIAVRYMTSAGDWGKAYCGPFRKHADVRNFLSTLTAHWAALKRRTKK